MSTKVFIEESKIRIIDAVKAAAHAKIKRKHQSSDIIVQPKFSADAILPPVTSKSMIELLK